MSAPELHGWATARTLARRLGVTPDTVRRRAARGELEVLPNPLGVGAIYRAPLSAPTIAGGSGEASTPVTGGMALRRAGNPRKTNVRRLRRGDGAALACLPCTTTDVASELGIRHSTAWRTLERLEREGFATRDGHETPGPRGGRPATWWRPVPA